LPGILNKSSHEADSLSHENNRFSSNDNWLLASATDNNDNNYNNYNNDNQFCHWLLASSCYG
jgi:hypothetical protein